MTHRFRHCQMWLALASLSLVSSSTIAGDTKLENMQQFPNPSGSAATFSTTGKVDLTGPFFQSLGTNGRSCATCHQASDGWTIIPAHLQQRFDATGGTDPVFRTVDGSNAPNLDVSTLDARRSAYSMLLSKGLIRIGIGIPAGARVRSRRRGRSLRVRERDRAFALSPAAAVDQSCVPEHRDVGRPRDLQGPDLQSLPRQHHDLLRDGAVRPRRPVELGDDDARARRGVERRAAPGDRRLRIDALHCAGLRQRCRRAPRGRRHRRAGLPVGSEQLLRHQRCDRRRLPDAQPVQRDRHDRVRRLEQVHRQRLRSVAQRGPSVGPARPDNLQHASRSRLSASRD